MSLFAVQTVALTTSGAFALVPKVVCKQMLLRMRDGSPFLLSDNSVGANYITIYGSVSLEMPAGYDPGEAASKIYAQAKSTAGTLEVMCVS
jgi:hypothetical protein